MTTVAAVCCSNLTLCAIATGLVLAPNARADIVIERQSGAIIATGTSGTVQGFAPDDAPWSGMVISGGSPDTFTSIASASTSWSATQISIQTQAEIWPGVEPAIITEAVVLVDVEFELTAAAQVEVRFEVTDNLSVPPPPLVFTTTRIVDLTTVEELMTTPGIYVLTLPAGPYRMGVQNLIGNTEQQLGFAPSARGISGVIRILEPCDIDFNNDGLVPDVQDIADLLEVFAGGACPTGPDGCDSVDFNGDGLFPDVQDIADFLTAFAGGAC